jgi:HK97 family phage portal protein
MAIFDGLRKRLVSTLLKGFSITRLFGTQSAAVSMTYQRKVGDGTECDVIMIPVLWAARRMGESPIGLRKIDDQKIDFSNPYARLLKRPSPWYSGSAFRTAQTIEWMLDGNTYAWKIRGPHKEVLAEQFIPHWAITPHVPQNGFIDYYEYFPSGVMGRSGGRIQLAPEDIVHLRNGVDPNNPTLGLSPLKILLREIYTDVEASEFTSMLLKNAGVMGVVISPKDGAGTFSLPGEKPEDAKRRVQESWSGTRRGEAMIAAGPLDVNYVGVDAAKLDLSRLRDIPEERVTALLGIPAAVAGLGTGLQTTKVGATMVEMRLMAYEDCIIPMQNAWADDWDFQLLPEFESNPEKFCTAWDLSKVRVLQDDENKMSERLTRQFAAGGITRMEYKDKLGYETAPEDDVYYISIATQIIPKALADGSIQEPPPASVPPKALPAPDTKATRAPANISRLMHRLDAERKRKVASWTAVLEKRFREYGDLAAETFERVANEYGMKAEPDWTLLGELTDDHLPAFDLAYEPEYLSIAKQTYESLNTVLGLGVNLSAPAEQRIIAAGGVRKGLIDVARQTKDAIFAAIEQGRAAGEGAAVIADLIREMVGAGRWGSAATRAMVIARTEAKYAQNISTLEAYKDSDTITGVEVFDAQLGPTDEECTARNQRIVTFRVGDLMVENEHPNGTLSLSPYMGELPDDADEEQRLITFGAEMPETKRELALPGGNGRRKKNRREE